MMNHKDFKKSRFARSISQSIRKHFMKIKAFLNHWWKVFQQQQKLFKKLADPSRCGVHEIEKIKIFTFSSDPDVRWCDHHFLSRLSTKNVIASSIFEYGCWNFTQPENTHILALGEVSAHKLKYWSLQLNFAVILLSFSMKSIESNGIQWWTIRISKNRDSRGPYLGRYASISWK